MAIGGAQSIFSYTPEFSLNFDWVDLASATGYVNYDCLSTYDSSAVNKLLVESDNSTSLLSVTGYTGASASYSLLSAGTTSTSFVSVLDIDWDSTPFQLPRTLKGSFYVKMHVQRRKVGGVDAGDSHYIIVRLRKWDGSAETEIVSVQSPTITYTADGRVYHCLSVTVPQTNFKKGEQLRITTEAWVKVGAGTLYVAIAGDPTDSATTDGTNSFLVNETRILCAVPFKINI